MNNRKNRYNKTYKQLLPKYPFIMLDIGCGKMIHTKYFNFSECVAVDVKQEQEFKSNISFIKSDVFDYFNIYSDTFDVVVGMNLIEHFEKNKSLKLISLLKSRVNKILLLQTPDGFIPNCQFQGQQYLSHLCGYSQNELESLNFKVIRLKNDMLGFKKWFDKNKIKYPQSWDRLIGVWEKK